MYNDAPTSTPVTYWRNARSKIFTGEYPLWSSKCCMCVRVCGCAGVRVCGCAGVLVCGCAGVLVCGFAGVRVCISHNILKKV